MPTMADDVARLNSRNERALRASSRGVVPHQVALAQLMGLAVFGEKVAARTYAKMAELRPEYAPLLQKFSAMEAHHGSWFLDVSRANGVVPDREFASGELGYLLDQVDDHAKAGNFDALAILQGFIVESLAIATYEPFLSIADRYEGAKDVFARALAEERYHVDWIIRYLRLRYFDVEEELLALAERVNVQGVDCVGGSLMNIADSLEAIGMSGADCAGAMLDGYAELLEAVGLDQRRAIKNVVSLFVPLMAKYRRGEKTK
jgi:rubrerythrin